MMFRRDVSQKGFSLPKILITLAIAALIVLIFLPRLLPGTNIDIINQLSSRAKSLTSSIGEKLGGIGDKIGGIKTKLTRKIQALADKWNLEKISDMISEVVAYRLSPEALNKMEEKGVPPDIVDNLRNTRSLKGREFTKDREADFWATVRSSIGQDAVEDYRKVIEESTVVRVEDRWVEDMEELIRYAKANGYDMSRIEDLMDMYDNAEASWKRVESEFWNDVRTQTRDTISKNIDRFRTRALGCSDYTVEMRKIWDIVNAFNDETIEGYITAKELSNELSDPRSEQFLNEFLHWLEVARIHSSSNWSNSWLLQQLRIASGVTAEGQTPNYPEIIRQIDAKTTGYSRSIEYVLKDIVVAEIFLQYNLINPAENRFDEAIRNFSRFLQRYEQNPYSRENLGLHMAMGLLHERVCKNRDLAIKEFKEVVAIARRLGMPCQVYSQAHHHLGVLSMNIRADQVIEPEFEESPSSNSETTEEQLTTTPTPVPTATPAPTATPLIKLKKTSTTTTEEEWVLTRELRKERPAGDGTPQPVPSETPQPDAAKIEPVPTSESSALAEMGGYKGTIYPGDPRRLERDIRLRPRKELGDTVKMKKFDVNDLYDLSQIPDDAAREFEQYLQCTSVGDRSTIARFIHNKYINN